MSRLTLQRREKLIRKRGSEAGLLSEGQGGGQVQSQCSDLVARAQGGDLAAFDELYKLHRDAVYTLCLNLCGNREQAQDLLQATFVKGWRGLQGFQGRSAFSTWLHRVAVNVCRDAERRRRAQVGEAHAMIEEESGHGDQTVERVRATLGRLKKPYRVVLALRYTLSLSYEEIAETLGWSLPKVKVTLHRAKAAFRKEYEADGD